MCSSKRRSANAAATVAASRLRQLHFNERQNVKHERCCEGNWTKNIIRSNGVNTTRRARRQRRSMFHTTTTFDYIHTICSIWSKTVSLMCSSNMSQQCIKGVFSEMYTTQPKLELNTRYASSCYLICIHNTHYIIVQHFVIQNGFV